MFLKKTVLQNIERIQLLWICNDALPSRACMPWYGVVVTHIIWLSMPMQLFLDSSWNSYWCSNSCNAMINSKGIFRDCEGCSVAFSFQYSLCIFAQTGIKLVKKANYPRDLSVLYFSISVHVILHDKKTWVRTIFASNLRSYFVEQFSLRFIASHYLEITKKTQKDDICFRHKIEQNTALTQNQNKKKL